MGPELKNGTSGMTETKQSRCGCVSSRPRSTLISLCSREKPISAHAPPVWVPVLKFKGI